MNLFYRNLLDKTIKSLFRDAYKIVIRNPASAVFILKTIHHQINAVKTRKSYLKQGVNVPPFLIFSITSECNLLCKGCYSRKFYKQEKGSEIDTQLVVRILNECKELGINIVLLSGGEPLLKKDLFEITKPYPEIIFPLFTNGLLINNDVVEELVEQRNVIPILSIEGDDWDTNNRRGRNVFEKVYDAINILSKKNLVYGLSLTVTKTNFGLLTNDKFVKKFVDMNVKLFFFVEYIPVEKDFEENILSQQQQEEVVTKMRKFREKYPALFIAFPGDEELFDGCLASGRGFVHINPQGDVEPCPFAPYSDVNLKTVSLKEALKKSVLLDKIRNSHSKLKETKSGCALWENRKWVESLIK